MSKHTEITKEVSAEERKNHYYSFIVGIFIAMGVIVLLVVLSLTFPSLFNF